MNRLRAESRADRRARARALAGFFAAGAVVSTTVLVLPGWEQVQTAGVATTIVAAALGALGLCAMGERLNPAAIHLLTASGTVLIAACQVLAQGGSPTAMYAMLYIWVILHCSLFFSRTVVAVHLTMTTLVHAAALIWLGDLDAIAPQLALTLVTQLAAALVVSSLARRQRELADTDSLTGLGNRRTADRALEWALERSGRDLSLAPCVALFDLDGFKAFNDERGHVAGDQLLIEVATEWGQLVRNTDLLARTGGDEFLLVLMGCDLPETERVVRRMIGATPSGVGCSAGIARSAPGETAIALLQRADAALYMAKTEGRVVIAPDVTREAVLDPH